MHRSLGMCTPRTIFGRKNTARQDREFYVLSESVQRIGQISAAIFTQPKDIAAQSEGCASSGQERLGTMVNSRSASMRSANGGWVLNSEDKVPPPNHGFTIQSAAVDGETLVVGMRWL